MKHPLDDLVEWFTRFVTVVNENDLYILALWVVHTHLVEDAAQTTPRLILESATPGSGKTTVFDHFKRLCYNAHLAVGLTPAVIGRLLAEDMATLLLDEVDRVLRPDKPGVEDMIAIVNSGYRQGSTRILSVPSGKSWEVGKMPIYAPMAMAGNSPHLPADTLSRAITVVLMPDKSGSFEDSDWEVIGDESTQLYDRIVKWTNAVRDNVKELDADLPDSCRGRMKEKWRPLKRIAVAANNGWPEIVDRLVHEDMEDAEYKQELGSTYIPPAMVLLHDLYKFWPTEDDNTVEDFVPTADLAPIVAGCNVEYWGPDGTYKKVLTPQQLGILIHRAFKIRSNRNGVRNGPRGFHYSDFIECWARYGVDARAHITRRTRIIQSSRTNMERSECAK